MPRLTLVQFPAFRHHERARQEANDGMMALLVGAQISARFLDLTKGSSRLLPEILPGIAHVQRINLRPDVARGVLLEAERHLGAMAVPYALSIHEAFIQSCLEILGVTSPVKAWQMHSRIETLTSGTFSPDFLSQFHVLREMRNCMIHSGGEVDQRLMTASCNLTTAGEQDWKKLAGRSPAHLRIGDRITLELGELVMTLATTKSLAREANNLLITAVPGTTWADIIIADHIEQTRRPLNPGQRRKLVLGLRRFHYSAVTVSDSELEVAAANRNIPIK